MMKPIDTLVHRGVRFISPILLLLCCSCGTTSNLIQKSGEWERIHDGEYLVENCTWNVSAFHSTWRQTILCDTATGRRGWTWDFSGEKDDSMGRVVKTYPEIIFGRKPYDNYVSTSGRLPIEVSSADFQLDYEYYAQATGTYNTTTDISFTDRKNPGPANIRAKMMIWFDHQNAPFFPSQIRKKAVIGGRLHEVFIDPDHAGPEGPWIFIALLPDDMPSHGVLNLKEYIDYALSEKALKPEWYLSSIEIGSELANGKGEIVFNRFIIH